MFINKQNKRLIRPYIPVHLLGADSADRHVGENKYSFYFSNQEEEIRFLMVWIRVSRFLEKKIYAIICNPLFGVEWAGFIIEKPHKYLI